MATSDLYTVVGSLVPTRPCIRLLGGDVDDGITVHGLITGSATSLVQGNHTIGTITAWIMCPNDTGTYTIFSAGDNNVVPATESMELTLAAGKIQFKINDGAAARVDVITSSKVITPHTWHHVALVQDSAVPKIYIDGVEKPLTLTTSTELGQWFDDTDNLDNGCIGALFANNAYTQEFAGYISDVRVYSGTTSISALTSDQVKLDMSGAYDTLTTALTGLRAHYTFNRTVVNTINSGTFDGTAVGAIIYCDGNPFTSKLTFECGVPVTADNISIAANGSLGIGLVVQQA